MKSKFTLLRDGYKYLAKKKHKTCISTFYTETRWSDAVDVRSRYEQRDAQVELVRVTDNKTIQNNIGKLYYFSLEDKAFAFSLALDLKQKEVFTPYFAKQKKGEFIDFSIWMVKPNNSVIENTEKKINHLNKSGNNQPILKIKMCSHCGKQSILGENICYYCNPK